MDSKNKRKQSDNSNLTLDSSTMEIGINKQPRLEINESNEKSNSSNGELVFWKVFRNNVIFKKIFSNFKFNHIFTYDRVIGTIYIFKNFSNAKAIIIDKVMSKNYCIRNLLEVDIIISRVTKNTKENKEFFIKLFSTFPYYSKNTHEPPQFEDSQYWLQFIVESNNIPAYQAYITVFKLDQKKIISALKKFDPEDLDLDKLYKMQVYLESVGIKVNLVSLNDAIQTFPYKKKLKSLIKFYNTIIKKHTPNKKQILIAQQLNGPIDLNQLNQTQLNSTIDDISISGDQSLKDLKPTIHKIFKYLYSINKSNHSDRKNPYCKPILYYVYFKAQSKANLINNTRKDKKNKVLKSIDLFIDSNSFFEKTLFISNTDSCKDFQKSVIDTNFIPTESKTFFSFQRVIISTGDMALIDYLFSKFKNFCCFGDSHIYETLSLINKEEVFNYFYEKVESINSDRNSLWPYVSEELLENYEKLMKNDSKKFSISQLRNPHKFNLKNLERALRNPSLYIVQDNVGINSFNSVFCLKLYYGEQDLVISILEMLISLEKNSDYLLNIVQIAGSYQSRLIYKLLHWVFRDLSDQDIIDSFRKKDSSLIIRSGICPTNNQKYQIKIHEYNCHIFLFLWKCGRFDAFFKVFSYDFLDNFYNDDLSLTLCPLKLVDYFLESNNIEENEYFNGLIIKSAATGILSVFKAILIKKPSILKIKDIKNPTSIYSNKELKEIVATTIDNNNLELTHFLLQHINFSKKDLNYLNKL
ncbi:hypothetical protein DICPUDRAFT_151929 [Dictyostelium purpureum]|uniref:Uncharacterized protein n=1 Tax=Dictyostelium purpureum TaxID=5786 RepID=F0ZK39_DICPU|nr:uncharacterized protein DICPUDRAFT_151929 [Dictyostelium purpureum]EGC35692.1 hypothetical protein DICPUDRAFT_151929 [Dictyostelium purpureum]|eukprot:XP_003287792.1 hypothetical protein DICPUDRAFT_151929 [Dictyostelium purpureum]